MMLGQRSDEKLKIAKLAGQIGGKRRSQQMLEAQQMFYGKDWQEKDGYIPKKCFFGSFSSHND